MKSETKINIASASHIGALYDNGIKLLFRCKEIIVPIMEMVVPEFSDCSQQQIANCLDISSVSSEEIVKRALYYVARSFSEQLSAITGKNRLFYLGKMLFNLDLLRRYSRKAPGYNDAIFYKKERYFSRNR